MHLVNILVEIWSWSLCLFTFFLRVTILTTAYRWPFLYHPVTMLTELGVLHHRLITKTVDNVTPFLVDAKKRNSLWKDFCSLCIFIICNSKMYITFFQVKFKCFALNLKLLMFFFLILWDKCLFSCLCGQWKCDCRDF